MISSRRRLVKLGSGLLLAGLSIAIYITRQASMAPSRPLAQLASSNTIISHVYDGDTIQVAQGLQKYKIRLIGVDTPEVVDPRKPVQCFGQVASAHTKKIAKVGMPVRLEFDDSQGATDKYGRTLAYVYLSDGSMLNRELVEDGFAHEYTYNNNPYKYQSQFLQAQSQARMKQRGLWSPQTCNGDTTKAG